MNEIKVHCPFQSHGDACAQRIHFGKECSDKTFGVEYQMSGAEIENSCCKTQHHHHSEKFYSCKNIDFLQKTDIEEKYQ
jgi:hypothetical protein